MKLLILAACLIPAALSATAQHADVGEVVDVTKDDAAALTRMGRALYLDKADDHTKGALTATDDDKRKVKAQAKAIAEAREDRDRATQVQSPTGMAELIAATVASAVQAALSQQAAALAAKPGA
jgi:hypothetical protein